MLKMRLELLGDFEVLTAEDGEKGCAMAISESPDIILMDLEMPNVDGWEATRRLKGNPHLACLEQRLYCASEFWPSVGQLRGAHGKHIHLCLADDKPEVLEEPADLVLNIPLDLDEQSPADK